MAYSVRLDIFEGPLDLLLHLIRKNEVDIYDIPIAEITDQYLEYMEMLKSMNLDLAGEFLVMAATLVHIKSRMLLPAPEKEEGDDEEWGADPREELVRRLLEYRRYKEAASELEARLVLGRDVFARGAELCAEDFKLDEPLVDVSLFDLMDALREVLGRAPKTYSVDMTVDKFKVVDKINYIMDFLSETASAPFAALFPAGASKGEIIVTFLALLELAKMRMVLLHQHDGGIRVYLPGGASGAECAGPVQPVAEGDGARKTDR
ncbi:MAG TPA: segregation/condensation protein A [Deltaproteobacteria bacterium]|nr:segregation/condensation protein A [Deltaproteobacteria bacterium]